MRRTAYLVRSIVAVTRKNLLGEIRYPLNFALSLIMPFVWILPMYFLILSFTEGGESNGLRAWVGSGEIFPYFFIGFIVSYVVTMVFWRLGLCVRSLMMMGVLEVTWTMPVPRIFYLVAESLYYLIKMIFDVLVLWLLVRILFDVNLRVGPTALLVGTLFIVQLFGFGILLSGVVMWIKNPNSLLDTVNFFITTLSGTNNPPQVFPRFLLVLSISIPVTHLLDLLRVHMLGTIPLLSFRIELVVSLCATILVVIAGSLVFRLLEKKSRMQGTLHLH